MPTGVGMRIKQARINLGLTQDELAKRMGKSKSLICKVENGLDNLTSDKVMDYANALETTPSYLMGWEDEEPESVVHVTLPFVTTIEEQEMIEQFRCLDKEIQKVIRSSIQSAYDDYIEEKKEDSVC